VVPAVCTGERGHGGRTFPAGQRTC
jgi:hypothetical protein